MAEKFKHLSCQSKKHTTQKTNSNILMWKLICLSLTKI